MPGWPVSAAALVVAVALVLISCGGDGGPSPPGGVGAPGPLTEATPVFPPLEGLERSALSRERTNYREVPQYQLPDPLALATPSPDRDGAEFHPPESPACPPEWEVLFRPLERFQVCHPAEWQPHYHGFVTAGADDRWYAVGLYRFGEDGRERAHVSIYVTNPYSEPFLYVAQCEEPYQVALDGVPATLCADYPGEFPEARIIAYHLRQDDLDYFLNVVPIFRYDSDEGRYVDEWSEEDLATGLEIVQTLDLLEAPESP